MCKKRYYYYYYYYWEITLAASCNPAYFSQTKATKRTQMRERILNLNQPDARDMLFKF
jgi:hypothetical protein